MAFSHWLRSLFPLLFDVPRRKRRLLRSRARRRRRGSSEVLVVQSLESRVLLSAAIVELSGLDDTTGLRTDGTTHTHSDGSTPHEHEHYLADPYYMPPRQTLSNPDGWLSDTAAGAPLDIALTYLQSQAGQLGLTTAELNQYVVTDQYRSESLGVTHIYLRQLHGGLPVIGADININVSDSGQVLNQTRRAL